MTSPSLPLLVFYSLTIFISLLGRHAIIIVISTIEQNKDTVAREQQQHLHLIIEISTCVVLRYSPSIGSFPLLNELKWQL
jgi:hypothetical protein